MDFTSYEDALLEEEEEEEEPLLIYTAQGSPFRRKKLSVINGSPEQQRSMIFFQLFNERDTADGENFSF